VAGDGHRGPEQILIVEDEGLIAMDLQRRLRDLGYNVPFTAATAAEAIASVQTTRPDLVLMDIWLEGDLDGIEAAIILRQKFDIPVVFLTSHTDEQTIQRARQASAYGYLAKPFGGRELHATLQVALDKAVLERRIREQRHWLQAVLFSIREGIIAMDREGNVCSMNPAAETLTGIAEQHALGKPVRQVLRLVPDQEGGGGENLTDLILSDEQRPPTRNGTCLCLSAKGNATPVEVNTARIGGDGRPQGAVLALRDISERKRAEEEIRRVNESLHQLSGDLLHLQDEERRRLARELHDSTGQVLAALCMMLSQADRRGLGEERRHGLLGECRTLAEQCTRELRAMSYLLHPPLLDEFGLLSALENFKDGYSKRTSIQVTLDVPPGLERLMPELETALFRIVQEALANVHRHSGSPDALIRLSKTDGRIELEITDHGKGLPRRVAGHPFPNLGVGILGMRERARQLRGRLEVLDHGNGVTVKAVFPVQC
ncbi:MAG: response regulator, partial [Acidobacteria bacterium]|nr:response regulator [Acidobacteriota bacterium]